ncbi:MAG TPA: TolC family protein [bacterium]|nr:TolC family protein [bacterium]
MGTRLLASILLMVFTVASSALPARAQPVGPSAPPPPAQILGPIPAIPQVPTLPPRPLTIGDALTTGLQNSFQTRLSAFGVVIARAQLQQAVAQEAVTLSGVASFTANSVSGGAPLTGTISIPGAVPAVTNQPFTASGLGGFGTTPTTTVFALALKYPLYTGGALEAQVSIAQANLALAEAQFTTAAQAVVLSVRQAYYTARATQANVDAAQRTVDASRENVRVTEARVRVGSSPQFDLLQAQVQLAASEQALTTARTGHATGQQALAAALVAPLSTTFALEAPTSLPRVPEDVNALIQQALQHRPEIAAALASERAAQAAIDLAASGLAPNITVTGGPQIQTSNPTSQDTVNFTGAIVLTLAILDGGLTDGKVAAARASLAQSKVSEEQTRQQVELDVRNAYLLLGGAADVLRSARVAQAAATEALRIANVRFQAGVGTQLEVVTAVQNLATADSNVIQSALQYFVAAAQLDRAVGIQVEIF